MSADRTAELAALKARLSIVDIISRYVPLKRQGREHVACCPFHQDRSPSFSVNEAKGFYHCFGCGQHGDVLDFVMEIEGLDFQQARERCAELAGVGTERSERPARPAPARLDRRDEPERYDTLAPWARAFWSVCRPILSDTPAAAYLASRGCALPPWPEEGDLRWHPAVKHRKTDHVGPALVALVTDAITAEPISLHRTWIKADGSGKADLEQPRLLLAQHRSDGVIRLWPDAEVTTGLVIGEGIETCLAAAAAGLAPVWATLNAGNLRSFPVLPGLEGLTVLADHDTPHPKTGKRVGIDAAAAVVARYREAGFDAERDLVVILPPGEGQDAADLAARATA